MKTIKLVALFIIYNLTFNISYAQSPVNSVGSGCALNFDGITNYVEIPASPSLLNLNKGTISLWLKIQDLSVDPARIFAVADSGLAFPSSDQCTIDYRAFNHSIQYSVVNGGTSISIAFTPDSSLNDTEWHFISVVSDQIGSMEIYIDGISQSITSCCGVPISDKFIINAVDADNIKIGAIARDLIAAEGSKIIDEVRIWNRALTQAEIRQNMCQKLTGTEAGLVGYWRFDDCGSLTAIDATANGNNGTLN